MLSWLVSIIDSDLDLQMSICKFLFSAYDRGMSVVWLVSHASQLRKAVMDTFI